VQLSEGKYSNVGTVVALGSEPPEGIALGDELLLNNLPDAVWQIPLPKSDEYVFVKPEAILGVLDSGFGSNPTRPRPPLQLVRMSLAKAELDRLRLWLPGLDRMTQRAFGKWVFARLALAQEGQPVPGH